MQVNRQVNHLVREQVIYYTSANANSKRLNMLIFQLVEPCGVLRMLLLQI